AITANADETEGDRPDRISASAAGSSLPTEWQALEGLARRCGSFPATLGNHVAIYNQGQKAFNAMLDAIRSARHHIHLETFIFQRAATGREFLDAPPKKARAGVQVRLLYDAMGTHRLKHWVLRPLCDAGGHCAPFLPLNPFRRRIQVNMRNHRKILVVDGKIGFTGGLNVGDEYRSQVTRFGFWRDT